MLNSYGLNEAAISKVRSAKRRSSSRYACIFLVSYTSRIFLMLRFHSTGHGSATNCNDYAIFTEPRGSYISKLDEDQRTGVCFF